TSLILFRQKFTGGQDAAADLAELEVLRRPARTRLGRCYFADLTLVMPNPQLSLGHKMQADGNRPVLVIDGLLRDHVPGAAQPYVSVHRLEKPAHIAVVEGIARFHLPL